MLGEVSAETDKGYIKSQIDNFKAEARRFYGAFERLLSHARNPALFTNPELKAEFDTLSQRGGTIRRSVESVMAKVDAAINWLRGTGASNALGEMYQDGHLGFLPLAALLPLGLLAGALALMGKYVADVYLFERKLTEANKLLSQGLTPAETGAILTADVSPGFGLPNVQGLTRLLVIGGALFLAWKVFGKK